MQSVWALYNIAAELKRHKLLKDETHHIRNIREKKVVKASQLKHHKQVKHEGMPYKCVPFSVEHSSKHSFNDHTWPIHGGIKFKCDICSRRFSSNHNMREHQSSKHEGTKFKWDSCDYQKVCLHDIYKHYPACLPKYKLTLPIGSNQELLLVLLWNLLDCPGYRANSLYGFE